MIRLSSQPSRGAHMKPHKLGLEIRLLILSSADYLCDGGRWLCVQSPCPHLSWLGDTGLPGLRSPVQGSRGEDLGAGGCAQLQRACLHWMFLPGPCSLTCCFFPSFREIPGTEVTKDLLVGKASLGTLESLVTKATRA